MTATQPAAFNALETFRAIAQDETLRSTEKATLWAAIFHTDNSTAKVRASQAMIAKRAGLSVKTVERTMRDEKLTARYFAKVERGRRSGRAYVDVWWHSPETRAIISSHPTPGPLPADSGADVPGHDVRTSTSLSTTPLRATTDSQPEPTFHVVEHQRPRSGLSEDKQRRIYERQMARDEGLNESGEPLETRNSTTGYRRRNRV